LNIKRSLIQGVGVNSELERWGFGCFQQRRFRRLRMERVDNPTAANNEKKEGGSFHNS